jgi:hypothetical protein
LWIFVFVDLVQIHKSKIHKTLFLSTGFCEFDQVAKKPHTASSAGEGRTVPVRGVGGEPISSCAFVVHVSLTASRPATMKETMKYNSQFPPIHRGQATLILYSTFFSVNVLLLSGTWLLAENHSDASMTPQKCFLLEKHNYQCRE